MKRLLSKCLIYLLLWNWLDKIKIKEVEAFTEEEKKKLYQAIGYSEEENYQEYPIGVKDNKYWNKSI